MIVLEVPYKNTVGNAPHLSIFCSDPEQKNAKSRDSFMKESAPPGGFDVHHAPLVYTRMKNALHQYQ